MFCGNKSDKTLVPEHIQIFSNSALLRRGVNVPLMMNSRGNYTCSLHNAGREPVNGI